MTEAPAPEVHCVESVDVDVLIVGGGVAGLHVLKDLRAAGYSAILVERGALGGEQTNHSHLYLHRGHVYDKEDLSRALREAAEAWDGWLEGRERSVDSEGKACERTYFGFDTAARARGQIAVWEDAGIHDFKPVDAWPEALSCDEAARQSGTSVLYETEAVCVTGTWLVTELARDSEGSVGKISHVEAIETDTDDSIVSVRVSLDGHNSVRFRPRMLVSAAGFANQRLLELVNDSVSLSEFNSDWAKQQVVRWAHMLVVRGPSKTLPPLTGIFHPSKLFIASRRLAGGDTVWVVSDDRSPNCATVYDQLAEGDERAWFPKVWEELRALAPRIFGRPDGLRWGIYSAPKAEVMEGDKRLSRAHIDTFGISNLRVVWPTKLTLAPTMSAQLVDDISAGLGAPSRDPSTWKTRRDVSVAPERWRTTGLLPWDDFRLRHL